MKNTDVARPDGQRRPTKTSYLRWVIPWLLAGGALAVVLVVLGRVVGHHVEAMAGWIAGLGPWAFVVYVAVFVVTTSLLVPDTVLAITAGALFGPALGITAVTVGNLIAAALQYEISSRLVRARVEAALQRRPTLAAIERAVKQDEFRLQVLLRMTPLNPATVSYLLGAAGVRFKGFLIACLAITPAFFTEVWFGQAGWHMARIAGRGGNLVSLHDLPLLLGLVACIAVVVIMSKLAHRALMQAIQEGNAENESQEEHVHAER